MIGRIRFSSIISDPERYIEEMFQLHPDSKHNKESGKIDIQTEIINSSFQYLLLEDGFFLFSFSSYSPVDVEYEFIPNPNSDYFSLVFYFTQSRSKNPLYIKIEESFYDTDQVSMFFNGTMNAEIFIKAKQKASGIRLDIHKKWIAANIDQSNMEQNSWLKKVLEVSQKGIVYTAIENFQSLVQAIRTDLENTQSIFKKLQLKAQCYALVNQYFENFSKKEKIQSDNHHPSLNPALNYLEKSLHKDFPGNDYLAKLCNLSESSFNKKFKTAFTFSAAHHFSTLKMKEALRLLQMGASVKKVSHQIGYKDPSSFGRYFKQYFGASPASYIKL